MEVVPNTEKIAVQHLLKHYATFKETSSSAPFFVLLSGTQGSGKSTLSSSIQRHLSSETVVAFSIDDLYFPHSRLQDLRSSEYKGNPLLEFRGYPGTHDVRLLKTILNNLKNQRTTDIPIYDKSLNGGLGDRSHESLHVDPSQLANKRIDMVILDGWCLGFKPVSDSAIIDYLESDSKILKKFNVLVENVRQINRNLEDFSKEIYPFFDANGSCVIQLIPSELDLVYRWRWAQEENMMQKNGGKGMTQQQVDAFVDRYMVAYDLYLLNLKNNRFYNHDVGKHLILELDLNWLVTGDA
ncbi:hypothetical protein HK096_000149, partial [Nowakowskiella sp. JEL0078]